MIVAGTHSGCGKTTVTLGLLAALKKKGLVVQPFKTGPDFIDTGLHRMITGRPSRNLDLWMCGEEYVKDCFSRNSADSDMAVAEGVMGLCDGLFSTASLAASLKVPVVLVVDGYGMAETASVLVRGFSDFAAEKGINLAGVIFNRVASENHYQRLCADLRSIAPLGYLPRDLKFEIPHRHLGLTIAEESPLESDNIERLADATLRFIDVDALIEIAGRQDERGERDGAHSIVSQRPDAPAIAVAFDKAFNFYYEDNLDLLKKAGARIITFSPLLDSALPEEARALYIGGGYPEVSAEALSKNTSMRNAVRDWVISGKPVYAECGGLMFLSKGIYDFEGRFFAMAGALPFETRMRSGRSNLGYREIALKEDCIVGKKGERLRGHEFHYSEIAGEPDRIEGLSRIYAVENGSRKGLPDEGYVYKGMLASYVHVHFGSNLSIARQFVNYAQEKLD